MKCTIPEISWHNREPVLSVDLFPEPDPATFYRLASAGGDSHVLIWHINVEKDGSVKQEVISDLKSHQRSVNVVKWSPDGLYLASGDDDATIIIWQLKSDNIPSLDEETNDREKYVVFKILRGHKEDIYDLCWSPNCSKLVSGSIDNTAILWDVQKGKSERIMTDHKGFVQGVAWDPKGQYITTICTDRICRIYDNIGKHVRCRIGRGTLPLPSEHGLYQKEVKYFHDDTFKSFFRRLCFSPEGSILITPSGHVVPEESTEKVLNCTYIFTVDTHIPCAVLPLRKECSTVAKCCPILFELREQGPKPYINLPYRIVFAVGTDHDLVLYDTQQIAPFARYHNIHYTRLTDITWSNDGLLLIASSTDGYCTLITFEPKELGVQYVKEETEIEENLNASISTMEIIEIPEVLEKKEDTTPTVTPKKIKNKSILSYFKRTDGTVQSEEIVEIESLPKTPKEDEEKASIQDNKDSTSILTFLEKEGETEIKPEEIIVIEDEEESETVSVTPSLKKRNKADQKKDRKSGNFKDRGKSPKEIKEKYDEKPLKQVNSSKTTILKLFAKMNKPIKNNRTDEVIEIEDDEIQKPDEDNFKNENNSTKTCDKINETKQDENKKATKMKQAENAIKPPPGKKPKRITPLRIA